MKTRMTIDQLEQMKTHELADLLADVVLLLRRMPNVECRQLVQQAPSDERIEEPKLASVSIPTSSFTREELGKKKVEELKALAKKLNVFLPAKIKKEDMINRILDRPANGHSEQWAIRDI